MQCHSFEFPFCLKSLLKRTAILFLMVVPAIAEIKVASPVANSSGMSPVHFAARATASSGLPVMAMSIYVDNQLLYKLDGAAVDVFLPLSVGKHSIVFQTWDSAGNIEKYFETSYVNYGVSVASPAPNASVNSPVHISASANSSSAITMTKIYVDNVQKVSTSSSAVDVTLSMAAGLHNVVVQSWDQNGHIYKTARQIGVVTGTPALAGRDQFLQQKFQAGVAHIDGRYGFTQNNFLVEGGSTLRSFGDTGIFVYLYPGFRTSYPDKATVSWPATTPTSLTQLAQTTPYKQLFGMGFKVIVLTTLTFSNGGDNVLNFNVDPTAAAREEQEMYDLTTYLLTHYKGSGKTFILKNWETDQLALQGDNLANIPPEWVSALKIWFAARQRGVARARNDAGNPAGVAVLHAIEVSRVLDYTDHSLTRTINAVVPAVKPDMVTYSSYDSSLQGTDSTSLATAMNRALNTIRQFSSDPMYLRDRRILISEYGLFENVWPTQTYWRSAAILNTSKSAGLSGAFLWQIYDNECKMSNGSYFPVDSSWGSVTRPTNSQCLGLWLVKPDGTLSTVMSVIKNYW
ncbi:MAG: hypothetical protein ACM3JB_17675 [Acidobacteriaceae bacterium]